MSGLDMNGDVLPDVDIQPEPLRAILASYLLSAGWRQSGVFGREWSSWRHGCACVPLADAAAAQLESERTKHLDRKRHAERFEATH